MSVQILCLYAGLIKLGWYTTDFVIGHHHITDIELLKLHGNEKKHKNSMLEDISAFSLTTDIWTSSVSLMSLISLTSERIDEEFTLVQNDWNRMYYILQSLIKQKQALGQWHCSPVDSSRNGTLSPYSVWRVNLKSEPLRCSGVKCESCCDLASEMFEKSRKGRQHQNNEENCSCEETLLWHRALYCMRSVLELRYGESACLFVCLCLLSMLEVSESFELFSYSYL